MLRNQGGSEPSDARAAVFDARGVRLGRADSPFATARPLPDHAEHASDEIWGAVCASVRAALAAAAVPARRVFGLAFDATCSLVLLDAAGRPVSMSSTGRDRWNVVMWADHRAIAEAEEITATCHRVLAHVGGVMSPEMQLPKLLWLKRHRPGAWARAGLALDLTDFLAWRATGRVAVSACTVTCKWTYLNHETPGWQHDLLGRIGLQDLPDRTGLPATPAAIGSPAGALTPAAAAELGLTTRCMVGVGLIDAHAGGLGLLGGVESDQLDRRIAVIAGTSTCHMAAATVPRPIPGVWGPYYGAMIPGGSYWIPGWWRSKVFQCVMGTCTHQMVTLRLPRAPWRRKSTRKPIRRCPSSYANQLILRRLPPPRNPG